MTPKRDTWNQKQKERSKKRLEYFRSRYWKNKGTKDVVTNSKSGLGRIGELTAIELLKGAIDMNKSSRSQYDLEWNGLKIDVKTSNRIINGGKYHRWIFFLKQHTIVDYFLLLCLTEGKLVHVFLIPDKDLKVSLLSITPGQISRFQKYLIK